MTVSGVLFQPNDLSAPASFLRAAQDEAEALKPVLAHWVRVRDLIAIERLAHSDPDARHFRVATTGDTLFVKGRILSETDPSIARESQIAVWLYRNGVKVPRPRETQQGAFTLDHCGWGWSVYDFVAGTSFTGRGDELGSAAVEFGRLTAVNRQWPEPFEYESAAGRLAELATLVQQAVTIPELETVRANQSMLCTVLERMSDRVNEIEKRIALTHSDYHPRNLIVSGGRVRSIVDFEDVRAVPLHAACGFAAFKLIRQVAACRAREVDTAFFKEKLAIWQDGWARSFPSEGMAPDVLAHGACYSVLILLHTILSAALVRGDGRYMYDLSKQILSLREIDAVFGGVAMNG